MVVIFFSISQGGGALWPDGVGFEVSIGRAQGLQLLFVVKIEMRSR